MAEEKRERKVKKLKKGRETNRKIRTKEGKKKHKEIEEGKKMKIKISERSR